MNLKNYSLKFVSQVPAHVQVVHRLKCVNKGFSLRSNKKKIQLNVPTPIECRPQLFAMQTPFVRSRDFKDKILRQEKTYTHFTKLHNYTCTGPTRSIKSVSGKR